MERHGVMMVDASGALLADLCCVPVLAAVASGVLCTGKLISCLSCLHLLSIGLDDGAVKCQHLVKTIAL